MVVPKTSARRDELLERAYRYVLEHGIAALSLRPLAADVQSSPRVLLFLFGSKDELVRALIGRARADELQMLDELRSRRDGDVADLFEVAGEVWTWLAAPAHRAVLTLWLESYARSLIEPDGAWSGFAEATVRDWLDLLAAAQPDDGRPPAQAEAERTLVLAVLRGALLDLLATGDAERTTAAVRRELAALRDR
jgi:AcrR family transcriptional regulator